MSNIRVDYNYPIKDGTEVVFRSPVDCSQVTGLKVYYIGEDGNNASQEFAFADAHGNNVGDIDHLFAENVAVKVILDVTTGMAFVQNADTNAYLEGRFEELEEAIANGGGGSGGGATVDEVIKELASTAIPSLLVEGMDAERLTIAQGGGEGICMVSEDTRTLRFEDTAEGDWVILRGLAPAVYDEDAVNKGQLDAAVGDIESVLDHIIEIQNSLIGGEA